MSKFKPVPTSLPGVVLYSITVFADERGFFMESYNRNELAGVGLTETFVQDNHSCSKKGVLRGLHYQFPHPQGKLVRVLRGRIYDVVVDIRKGSPMFGKWIGVELDAHDHAMLWVPEGFAHGFMALEDRTEVLYKTTDFYYPLGDAGIAWNDPDLAIDWPLEELEMEMPLLTEKDAKHPRLAEIATPFEFREDS
jgi:dTDP-4-dehydrorhamnose 3,5-epimerase